MTAARLLTFALERRFASGLSQLREAWASLPSESAGRWRVFRGLWMSLFGFIQNAVLESPLVFMGGFHPRGSRYLTAHARTPKVGEIAFCTATRVRGHRTSPPCKQSCSPLPLQLD